MNAELASVELVWDWLDRLEFPISTATVEPSRAVGRALLFEFRAPHGLPQHHCAALSGHAVPARQTLGAGPYNPMPVQAAPVRAGAAIPPGTDAVLPDDAVESGMAMEAVAPGEGVIGASSQLRKGELLFPAGHVLRPQDVAVLAEFGTPSLAVRCGLLASGGVPVELDDLRHALLWRDLSQWDAEGEFVLTTTPLPSDRWDILAVAMRPASGCRFGWRDTKPLICLPSDPLGFTLAHEMFTARLLRRTAGLPAAHRQATAKLSGKIVSSIGHTDLALVQMEGGVAEPLPFAEAGGAAGLARADGFVIVPAMREGFPPGALVTVQLLAP